MTLSPLERQSALWQRIKAHYEQALADLRTKNDGNLDAFETARLRGQILEVKRLLALDGEPDEQTNDAAA